MEIDIEIIGSVLKDVEMFLFYDSFIFNPIQRKYPIYKKELCVIVSFCKKYDYVCKHLYKFIIVHTDYKFFIYFLSSDLHEDVYGNWVD